MRLHSASLRITFHSICNHSLKDSEINLDLVILGLRSFMYFTSCFSFLYENESSMQILAAKRNSKKTELKTLKRNKTQATANKTLSNLPTSSCKLRSQISELHRATLQHFHINR